MIESLAPITVIKWGLLYLEFTWPYKGIALIMEFRLYVAQYLSFYLIVSVFLQGKNNICKLKIYIFSNDVWIFFVPIELGV